MHNPSHSVSALQVVHNSSQDSHPVTAKPVVASRNFLPEPLCDDMVGLLASELPCYEAMTYAPFLPAAMLSELPCYEAMTYAPFLPAAMLSELPCYEAMAYAPFLPAAMLSELPCHEAMVPEPQTAPMLNTLTEAEAAAALR